ncbi:MAG: hypothetical protein QOH01_2496 [Verrucomicrobiota bacterium]|jgi:hypothetical protein
MKKQTLAEQGSTLVVTVSVVATILVLLGSAVSYTSQMSRNSQRSRKTALAMEIADGHLETLFTNWRNISRLQVMQAIKKKISVSATALPTQYFFTSGDSVYPGYNPGPTPNPDPTTIGLTGPPPLIALPSKTLFPTEPDYTVGQYRIQAVDPMITLDASENSTLTPAATPPAAFGPNTSTVNGQYSYYYLASVDVTVPTLAGNVTAKVRRVFEKKFDEPFTFAMFFMDDLELWPANALTITGPVHTNGTLYIGTSNFTAPAASALNSSNWWQGSPTSGKVTFATSYVNGPSPQDTIHSSSSATSPNFPTNQPPMTQPPHLPYGWNLNLDASTSNNENYHELIERPDPAATTDPIASIRFYNQADYHVLIDNSTPPDNIKIYDKANSLMPKNTGDGKVINEALTNGGVIDQAVIQDVRESGPVLVTTVNVGDISSKSTLGMIYISDTTAGTPANKTVNGVYYTTTKRGIRIRNGAVISPSVGLTFVSENPVYIQGDFNTGGTPPTNSAVNVSPLVSGYTWKPVAVVADAINVLSNAWNDTTATGSRVASNTTINAALIAGNVPSNGTYYSGGGENFVRLLENWGGKSFTFYGSMIQLWQSKQATGPWTGDPAVYTSPTTNKWFYDIHFAGDPNNPPSNSNPLPPGNFQLAAYLQQQRWYQVY